MYRLFLLGLFACLPIAANAKSSVWKAEKNGAVVYLGGTIHLLRQSDYPLPSEFEQAYLASDSVSFETDIASLNSPAIARDMILRLSYSGDKTIASEVSAETYQRLQDYAKQYGLSLDFYRKAKPGMLMSMFMLFELKKIGVTEQGIDMHFSKRAQNDGKQALFLESVEEQLGFMARMGIGNEDTFYQNLLRELDSTNALFIDMLKAWREGNTSTLETLAVTPMQKDFPAMYQFLLVERNNNWMPAIEKYFETKAVEFVLVGAAHLVGEQGLISQLSAKGYKITKL